MLTNATWITWKTERRFFDKDTEEMWKDVQNKLPGYEIAFTSTNRAEDKFIVAAFSDKTRGKRYVYDKATKKLTCSPTCHLGCRRANSRT